MSTPPALNRLLRWRPGLVARNTFHASVWNGVRIALQAASLVLMARVLGVEGYGALAGTVALFMACGQFTGLGSGIALVRHAARGGPMRRRFAATVRAYLLSGIALTLLVIPLALVLLGAMIPLSALVLLAMAETLLAPLLLPLVYRYQAEERMFLSSAIGTLAPVVRLIAVAAMAALGAHSIASFAQIYVASLVPVVAITLWLGWPRKADHSTCTARQAVREGLPYAVSGFALSAGSELDKTVLLRLAGEAVTGPYAAAYRIASAATLPVNALILAASPRLFRVSSTQNPRLAAAMLAVVTGYGLLAAAALWLLAPFAPWLLGHGFDNATSLLRWMCILVVTGSLRQYTTALLTTGDMQGIRNTIEIGAIGITLGLLLLLVPSHGAYGAIFAAGLGDAAIILAGTMFMTTKKRTRTRNE